MNSLTGLIVIGVTVWLLFLGGCEAVQRTTASYTAGQPVLPAIQHGVQQVLATPRITFSTPVAIVPKGMPRLPTAAPISARAQQPQSQSTALPSVEQPTEVPTPMPVSGRFWTPEEVAAFTATAEAWYDPQTLPTAPPEFVEYAQNACATPEIHAKSIFCP